MLVHLLVIDLTVNTSASTCLYHVADNITGIFIIDIMDIIV